MQEFENIRRNGLFAINLREGDELVGVHLTDGNQEVLLGTKYGMSIRFPEQEVREMGRAATGVKGITLAEGDEVIDMDVATDGLDVMIVTSKGYGKRTPLEEYRVQSRGGKGIKTLSLNKRKGFVVAHKVVSPEEDLMIVTTGGVVNRQKIAGISTQGRYAQGVKLIHLKEGEEVATVAPVHKEEENGEETSE